MLFDPARRVMMAVRANAPQHRTINAPAAATRSSFVIIAISRNKVIVEANATSAVRIVKAAST